MSIPQHHPDTASRVYTDEAVIISPATNRVVMLNPVGSRIWELIDGAMTVDEIATTLVAEFDVDQQQAHESTLAFLSQLEEKQLIDWL